MTDRFESMKKTFNESHKNMSKEGVVGFANKILDYGAGREKANVAADIFIADLLVTQQGKIDELKKQDWTIEYSRKVKVPPFMTEFLDFVKENGDDGITAYDSLFTICSSWPKEEILNWSFEDSYRFIDAVRYGYEVEEEPKWLVKKGDCYIEMERHHGDTMLFEITMPSYFECKRQAEIVAELVGGTVEEVNNE